MSLQDKLWKKEVDACVAAYNLEQSGAPQAEIDAAWKLASDAADALDIASTTPEPSDYRDTFGFMPVHPNWNG